MSEQNWIIEGTQYQGEGSNVSVTWTATWSGKTSVTINDVDVYKEGTTTDASSTYMPSGSHSSSGNVGTFKPLTALVGGEYYILNIDATVDGVRDYYFMKVGALKASTGKM